MDTQQRENIGQLYRELYPSLLQYAQSRLGTQGHAEEAVQETFRIACAKADDLLKSSNPRGWLLNTLKYTLQNMIRSMDTDHRLLSNYLKTQPQRVCYTENGVRLELAYGNISELEEFKLIKEFSVEQKSCLEIARSRGITLNACKKRLQRAREILREKINL